MRLARYTTELSVNSRSYFPQGFKLTGRKAVCVLFVNDTVIVNHCLDIEDSKLSANSSRKTGEMIRRQNGKWPAFV